MRNRNENQSYAIIKLDALRGDSWAVIGLPGGAIALDADGELVMRLEKAAAEQMADALNRHAPQQSVSQPPRPHQPARHGSFRPIAAGFAR